MIERIRDLGKYILSQSQLHPPVNRLERISVLADGELIEEEIYLSNIFTSLASPFDLFLVGRSSHECFGNFFSFEIVKMRSNPKSSDSIGVEVLISEERFDDRR